MSLLKEASISSNRLWKAAGKPRSGPLFQKRQSCRLQYRKRLKEEEKADTVSYTNELHEALLTKKGNVFWKCWNSKFEQLNRCTQVEGFVDANIIADKFAEYFSRIYTCNNADRAESLKQDFLRKWENYYGFPIVNDLPFDTELVSNVIFTLKRGKASDVDGLMAEHLLFCHPVVLVILCKFFQVILLTRYIPTGFKRSYIVPVPKVKGIRSKALTCDDFRGIAISPILSKV